MNEELKKYIEINLIQEKANIGISNNNFKFNVKNTLFGKSTTIEDKINLKEEMIGKSKDNDNLDDFIKENNIHSNFQTTLFKMIDERNLVDSDVYNKVHIDRRLFSKIRNDNNYHPSKETIILLGLSLELNELEIENLLNSASYSLPKNNYYDLIIRFCFMKGIYKITDVNNLLDQYNCKLFNY